ncbi:MAG: VWA domain-containing protein [Spirochaetales bacterium]|nr:VWA domain-containing protein [Spirochaetales bacterium]
MRLDQIISRDFPEMTVYASVEDEKGEALAGLAPGLFRFRVDSLEEEGDFTLLPFSLHEEPVDYSLLFSSGGIMEGEPLEFQKAALLQFIDGLRDQDTLSLYTVGEEAGVLFEEQKKADIDTSLISRTTVNSGQPRLYDCLISVIRTAARRDARRKAVILISDGRDQGSRFTKEQLAAVLAESGLPVYAAGIRVLGTQSLSVLNEIADSTGGAYLYTRNLKDIPASLKNLARRITRCYVISLEVEKLRADDLPHTLELTVDERDAWGRGSRTFIAVKNPLPPWVKWAAAGLVVLFIVAAVVLHIIVRVCRRRRMGITRRRCPVCKRRMKDSWDWCPFCKYLPAKKQKQKEKKA